MFLHFAIEIKNKYMIFRKAQSRMQRFEELHATREPQVGHPCSIGLCLIDVLTFDCLTNDLSRIETLE